MDVENLAKELILKNMTPEQQMAVLDSVRSSVAQAKEVQKRKIGENVDLVVQALKKIESDIRSRFDDVGNSIEKRVASIKDGRDGINGKDGRDGKDGRSGKDGAKGDRGDSGRDGRDGVDGVDGVSVTSARIDFDGSLVITLSSGDELNVGEVVAPDLAERIKVITNGGGTSQSVLDTLASLQAQITALIPSQTGNSGKFLTTNGSALSWGSVAGGLSYQGTWNATTNTPTLTSSVGTSGYYYVVATAGSTDLNGITDWQIGDWLIFNGSAWQKIDQTNLVISVAGRTGAVVLSNTDISGLGTMSTQNANSVAITGGTINGTTIGATTASTGIFTTLTINDNSTFGTSNSDTINFVGRINSDFDPATDNTYDLGRVGHEWRNLYIDGTANIDSLIADTADINAGTIDNTTIGATTPQSGSFVDLSVTGTTSFDGSQGTAGQVLTSAGTGATPTWTTPTTGTVTSVTGTSPVASSGGTTPAISLSSGYGDTQNPYASKTANYVLASPNASAGVPTFRALVAADVPTLNQNTTGSAATLTTPRAIYGNNFDGSAALTQVIASTYGGTGNGFTKFTGATTAERTYTLPDASSTIVVQGGALGTPSSGTVTNLTGTASININGTVGATTPAAGTFTSLSDSGNLTFTGTGNRITGDFSNATVANRVMFQSSTTNAQTQILAIPNGTSTQAVFEANSDSSGGTNAVIGQIGVIAGAEVRINSGIRGTGTYQPMTLHTGGSERIRIDSSGNVGIGTNSPTTKLTVGTIAAGTIEATYKGNIRIEGTETTIESQGGLEFKMTSDGYGAKIQTISSGGTNLAFATRNNSATWTERMRIDPSGNLLVGDTSSQNNSRLRIKGGSTSGSNYTLLVEGSGGADNFYVRDDGEMYSLPTYNRTSASAANVGIDAAGGFFRSTSSIKYKTDVQDATHGLADALKLRAVTYKGKNDGDTIFGGLIAEEVHEAGLTEFVQYAEDGSPDALSYGNMVSLAFKAIQEQQALITTLTDRITALEQA
jgi:hypothetical protein